MTSKKPERTCSTCGRPLANEENKRLLSPSTKYYAFRVNLANWGNGPIMDERGTIIGSVRTIGKAADLCVFDGDGTPVLSIRKKVLREKYELLDISEKRIARVHSKFLSSNLILYSFSSATPDNAFLEEKSVPEGIGSFYFDLVLGSGEIVAELRPVGTFPEIFGNIIFSFGDVYCVRVINPSVDRRFILGIVLVNEWIIKNLLGDDPFIMLAGLRFPREKEI